MLKRRNIFILSAVLSVMTPATLSAQMTNTAVTITSEERPNGDVAFFSNNNDYCDYYLILNFTQLRGYSDRGGNPFKTSVKTGYKNVTTLKKASNNSGYAFRWNYRTFRGDINVKPNLDYVYPLPVKVGDIVRIANSNRQEYETIFNLKKAGDTIYACREGIVCNTDLTDGTSRSLRKKEVILVYHKDHTFSEYSLFAESLVGAGDYITMGQPIAIVRADDKERKYVSFSVFYLDKNKVKDNNSGSKHSFLIPTFHTANEGNVKLDERTTYVSQLTDDIITQEMTDKEKKQFEKNKENGAKQ